MLARKRKGSYYAVVGVALFIITLSTTGCDEILGPSRKRAETASVELEGTSPGPLQVVTSTNWILTQDQLTGESMIQLFSAETTEAELPFEKSVKLAPYYRVLFRVMNPHPETAQVRMRVLLDGEETYKMETPVADEPVDFTYVFH